MTVPQNAGIHDLRFLLADLATCSAMPAGDGEKDAEDETEEITDMQPDPDPTPANDDEVGEVTGEDEDEEAIRNPRIKALSDENKRYRLAARRERERADNEKGRADGLQGSVSTLILENAFIKAAAGRVSDYDAALKLMDRDGIIVTAEGDITGVEEALVKVIERYPYVADEDGPADTNLNSALAGLQPSGRPVNGQRHAGKHTATSKALKNKFPALRHRR